MGMKLVDMVIENTGLPERPVREEMTALLERNGVNPETMTLDDLRLVMADYLQDVFLELKEKEGRPSAEEAV